MEVWEKIASHTSLDFKETYEWLNKYKIRACELENKIGYTGSQIRCIKSCEDCLKEYLGTNIDNCEFRSVKDEFGQDQLVLF